MQEITTLNFLDVESKQPAVAIIRAAKGMVAVAISVADDGDAEVVLSCEDCQSLVTAMNAALSLASSE